LDGGRFVHGDAVRRFEQRFAALCGAAAAVGTSSGTAALHLALSCAGVAEGDEVLVPGFTFAATAEAVVHCRARPVFVDVQPDSLCMDPADAERRITPRTRAMVPVHLFGQLADMSALTALATRHGLELVEDAAQAAGAASGDRRAGALARFGCFSLFPSKNLGVCGDGGVLLCADPDDAARARMLSDHGRRDRQVHEVVGYNYRLDTIQAAIADVKLDHLLDWNAARQRVAERYDEALRGLPLEPLATCRGHAHHVYVVRCRDRDALSRSLAGAGIASAVHYPRPVYRQPAFARWADRPLPVCEHACQRVLSLPMYPSLEGPPQQRVIAAVRAHYE
jgi:dTDP-4-amino-4,6-dideoxygalactose transaminase